MCVDPITALAIGSSVIGGVGAVQQGQAAAASARYNAKVSRMNAELADRRAKDALDRGATEEQQVRQRTAQLMGQQHAAMGANGVDASFGSPLDMIIDTATLGELDALSVRRNAASEAWDNEMQRNSYLADSKMQRASAKSASIGGFLNAAGTVLGGTSNAIGTMQMRNSGGMRVPTYGAGR